MTQQSQIRLHLGVHHGYLATVATEEDLMGDMDISAASDGRDTGRSHPGLIRSSDPYTPLLLPPKGWLQGTAPPRQPRG